AIYAALHVEGVQRAVINAPLADVVLDKTQAAWCAGSTITVGGTDD
ncbi:baseplate assembly protein, partial [Yersinia enterocolitica]|nr:baseplate assembly protein [Yersinia enterocolitica]